MHVRFAKVHRSNPCHGFIARETQIANRQFQVGKTLVEVVFPSIVMLKSFAERIPDETDTISFLKLQFCRETR
jgi:hypothetical protein